MKNILRCYDDETIKWKNDGADYCLHIQHDDTGDNNPRYWDDHDSVMACFHPRYRLGDKIDATKPEEFWNNMVYEHCSAEEIIDALKNMKLKDTCARVCEDMNIEYDEHPYGIFEINNFNGKKIIGDSIAKYLSEDEIFVYANGELSIRDCQILLEGYVVWLPLYLIDHSSLTMHCGESYCDSWDTSAIGWIVTECSNGSEDELEQIMRDEVKTYSDYISGENYCYTLYEKSHDDEDPFDDWVEIDSCGGFIGDDVIENGIAYNAGNGLEKSIESEKYEIGTAKKIATVSWEF